LNQANKARQSEAQTYIGAMNRAQQAYYLENREFADAIGPLELGLSDTENYVYAIADGGAGSTTVLNTADPTGTDLKGYAGRVWLGVGDDNNATTFAKVCESETADGAIPDCPED
jgi:type II secretory pathway pseudopilin PulG